MVSLSLFRTNRLRAKSNLVSLQNLSLPHQIERAFLLQDKNSIRLICRQWLVGRQITRRQAQGEDDKGRDSHWRIIAATSADKTPSRN